MVLVRVLGMGNQNSVPLLVLISMVAAAFVSLVAVAATPETADACSVAAPYAEASPTNGLKPGQQIKVAGWAFYDIGFGDIGVTNVPDPAPLPAGDDDPFAIAVPPELCDFDLFPRSEIVVTWSGNVYEKLAVVSGPEFAVAVTVPVGASPGPATITVGDVAIAVSVGPDIEPPPPPCPLAADHTDQARYECPEPWPCPHFSTNAGGTQPAPGSQLRCPEPCVDYAHTTADGTVYDYQWDCPHPCSGSEVDPGAPTGQAAVWCPEPEPCPLYLAAPGEAVAQTTSPEWCPDPCGLAGGDAVWCPEPEPCPVYLTHEAPTSERAVYCPDPCHYGLETADAVWCPTEPLALVSPPAPVESATSADSVAQPPQPAQVEVERPQTPSVPVASLPVEATEGARHVVDVHAVAGSMSEHVIYSLRAMLSSLFG